DAAGSERSCPGWRGGRRRSRGGRLGRGLGRLFGLGRLRGGFPGAFARTAGSGRGGLFGRARFSQTAEPAEESLDVHLGLFAVREGVDDGLAQIKPPEKYVAQGGIVLALAFPHLGQGGFEGMGNLLEDIESDESGGALQGVDGAEHAVL